MNYEDDHALRHWQQVGLLFNNAGKWLGREIHDPDFCETCGRGEAIEQVLTQARRIRER